MISLEDCLVCRGANGSGTGYTGAFAGGRARAAGGASVMEARCLEIVGQES